MHNLVMHLIHFLSSDPERKNGKRQVISTDVVQGAACVLARSERGAAHTRAGGGHGSVTSARGAGRGDRGDGSPALLHPPSAHLRPASLKNVTSLLRADRSPRAPHRTSLSKDRTITHSWSFCVEAHYVDAITDMVYIHIKVYLLLIKHESFNNLGSG